MTDVTIQKFREINEKIKEYLMVGGLFNPEMMEHEKVRDMILHIRDTIQETILK